MPATIPDVNRKAAEERINAGESALNDALSALATSLGSYGFKGRIILRLRVAIEDKRFGGDELVACRSTELLFKR